MDATMENKMGLPPPYEQLPPHPGPPPSYFINAPPPAAPLPRTVVITSENVSSFPEPTHQGNVTTSRGSTDSNVTYYSQSTNNSVTPPSGHTSVKLGPGPTGMVCPNCNKSVVTRVDHVSDNRTHIISAALCVVTGCCCACFVPYCMKSCKTANHYCPRCGSFVGSHPDQIFSV